MLLTKLRYVEKAHVSRLLITFGSLIVLAIFVIACQRDASQSGSSQSSVTQQAASPSPSPSPAPTKEVLPGDTIIVIRDGSVEIEIDLEKCQDVSNPSHPDTSYRCDNRVLDAMKIEPTGPPSTPKPRPTSRIEIDGGGGKKIVIKGNPNHVKIDFKKADYPRCGGPGKHCGANKVGTITMDDPPFRKECDSSQRCVVTIDAKK